MKNLLNKIKQGAITLTGIALVSAAVYFPSKSYFIADEVRTKITDAQMVKVDGRYMVATEYRPFVNHDAWYRGKFSSGSIQNQAIKLKGKEVIVRKYGWRNPIFSKYENIVDIKEIPNSN